MKGMRSVYKNERGMTREKNLRMKNMADVFVGVSNALPFAREPLYGRAYARSSLSN